MVWMLQSGQFQATNLTSLNVELERDAHNWFLSSWELGQAGSSTPLEEGGMSGGKGRERGGRWAAGWKDKMGDWLTHYLERWMDRWTDGHLNAWNVWAIVIFGKVYRRPREMCLLRSRQVEGSWVWLWRRASLHSHRHSLLSSWKDLFTSLSYRFPTGKLAIIITTS